MKVARIYPMRCSWETFNSCKCSIWEPSSCGCTLINCFLSVQHDCWLWRRGWNSLSSSIKIRQGSSYSVFIPAPSLCSQLFSFIILSQISNGGTQARFKRYDLSGIVCVRNFRATQGPINPVQETKERKEKTLRPVFSGIPCLWGKVWQPNGKLFQLKVEW